ncbi:ABC transporter substrate-binding protein [Carboxydochorda subterranea]|uniref:ABC transporter substrate-binding protein n=1 Tax=Carboxydichorda subterranea TaxID=3109565 RepID=A0ABZ1BWM8_9FIRM|nr:ABC transporter substrate-binding protein [Limnochorda sp. L945t]WRP17200.1 ABC transporter substrate-binding protein [Limnochorda sp. L945t]
MSLSYRLARIVGMVSAAFLAVLLAGVGAGAPAAAAASIVVGLQAEPTALDPHQISDYNSSRATMGMYDSLLRFKDGSTELEPGLAQSWTVSKDGLVYTLKLRRGVRFHDGTPFDADAVVFNIQRQIDPSHPYHQTGTFPYAEFTFGKVKRVEKVDAYTVRFVLEQRYAPFLANLAMHAAAMVSPAAIRKYGKEIAKHPVGTGPFRFVRWTPGVEVVVERNPDYWDKARVPRIQQVVYRPVVEDQTRLAQLEAGELDFIVNVPPDDLPRLRSDARWQVIEQPGMHIWYLVLNNQKPPFNDVRVRRAVNYAINRRAIVEGILKGTGVLADNYIPPVLWGYDEEVHAYPYDPEKARQLLAEAGYPKGLSVDFWVPQSGSGMQQPVAMAQAIQSDLAKVGIRVNIQTFEWGTYLDKVFASDPAQVAEMHEMSWVGDNGDPDNFLYILLSGHQWPPNGFNESFYRNPEVDRLLVAAQQSSDRTERAGLYKRAQALIMRDAPWVPFDHETQIVVARKEIQGFVLHPTGVFRFETVRLQGQE